MTPKAILHFDADTFFASVEQAADRHLRAKPKMFSENCSYKSKCGGTTTSWGHSLRALLMGMGVYTP